MRQGRGGLLCVLLLSNTLGPKFEHFGDVLNWKKLFELQKFVVFGLEIEFILKSVSSFR